MIHPFYKQKMEADDGLISDEELAQLHGMKFTRPGEILMGYLNARIQHYTSLWLATPATDAAAIAAQQAKVHTYREIMELIEGAHYEGSREEGQRA